MVKMAQEVIRVIRVEKKYSQEYVALTLKISQSYYSRIENGKTKIDLDMLENILNALNVDIIDFFTKMKKYN